MKSKLTVILFFLKNFVSYEKTEDLIKKVKSWVLIKELMN